jgi:hypothetical protein
MLVMGVIFLHHAVNCFEFDHWLHGHADLQAGRGFPQEFVD